MNRESLDRVVWNSTTRECVTNFSTWINFNAALWWPKAKLHLQEILISKQNFIFTFNLKSKLKLDSISFQNQFSKANSIFISFISVLNDLLWISDLPNFLAAVNAISAHKFEQEAYPKISRTSKMEVFVKLVTSWKLTIFIKCSILYFD